MSTHPYPLSLPQTAHEGIVSAMLCTKDYVITSSFASIKVLRWPAHSLN